MLEFYCSVEMHWFVGKDDFFKKENKKKRIFVNNQLDAQFFFMYVYYYSLHVSGSHVPIIRRINCINTTSGICHYVQMTVWCAGLDETASHPNLHTKRSSIQIDIHQMSY